MKETDKKEVLRDRLTDTHTPGDEVVSGARVGEGVSADLHGEGRGAEELQVGVLGGPRPGHRNSILP